MDGLSCLTDGGSVNAGNKLRPLYTIIKYLISIYTTEANLPWQKASIGQQDVQISALTSGQLLTLPDSEQVQAQFAAIDPVMKKY